MHRFRLYHIRMIHAFAVALLTAASILIASTAALPAVAITGLAAVTDGDTIKIEGARIRLVGIDAPELHQTCNDAGGRLYDCGIVSAAQLRAHVAGHPVSCQSEGRDRYGRTLAVCFIGSEDLNAWLVAERLAVAYRRYSLAYVSQEDSARLAHRGPWAGAFIMPWDWRKQH